MLDVPQFVQRMQTFGTGRRKLDDDIFFQDKPPQVTCVSDEDSDDLCERPSFPTCSIAGCTFVPVCLRDYESHYNASHRYSCSECKKVLPTPHLLDLHIQEVHDSFFAVMAAKKPSYCCYIPECEEKFMTPKDRMAHCVEVHQLPKDFRFDAKIKSAGRTPMDEGAMNSGQTMKKVSLNNSKQKTFATKYTGRKFTHHKPKKSAGSVNIDEIMTDIKCSLPK